jgi:hypothetical protein
MGRLGEVPETIFYVRCFLFLCLKLPGFADFLEDVRAGCLAKEWDVQFEVVGSDFGWSRGKDFQALLLWISDKAIKHNEKHLWALKLLSAQKCLTA